MSPPEPMLSASSPSWPSGSDWVLQAKWDGFRLLVQVGGGRVRAWSRHGTSLTSRLVSLLEPFAELPEGSVFDGELVALAERDGRPVKDFAAVGRAVLGGSTAAVARLQFVGFDVLALAAQDLRGLPWREPDQLLAEVLPASERIRPIQSLPASPAAHARVVELGFEGTVLKRPGAMYRPGRHTTWIKHKARHTAHAVLISVHQDRDGQWHAACDVGGRRAYATTGPAATELLGQPVTLVYSRVDADGGLREARLAVARRPEVTNTQCKTT